MAKPKKKTRDEKIEKRREKMSKGDAPAVIVAPTTKTPGGIIEEMWAENGTIRVLCADGVTKSMTWQSAAYRAAQLNAAVPHLPHAETKRQYLDLIERILAVVKEARHQLEIGDKKTEGLHNLLSGRNQDGSEVKLGKIEDYLIDDYLKQFPTMSEDEIMLILRNDKDWPVIKDKEVVMRTINEARLKLQHGSAGPDENLIIEASS